MYRDIPLDLRFRIEPVVEEQDCELVDVELRRNSAEDLIRITIDSQSGDGRVAIERCEAISREVEAQLDAAEFMPGRYRLEVTTPRLDRVLAREKDFAAACGKDVKIQTRRPLPLGEVSRRRFKGLLVDFRDDIAIVKVDGKTAEIPFEEVEKANSFYRFSREDFSGKSSQSASE